MSIGKLNEINRSALDKEEASKFLITFNFVNFIQNIYLKFIGIYPNKHSSVELNVQLEEPTKIGEASMLQQF